MVGIRSKLRLWHSSMTGSTSNEEMVVDLKEEKVSSAKSDLAILLA
jgi:hypothetical protein